MSILRSDYYFMGGLVRIGNLSSLGFLFFVFADSLALAVNYSDAFNKNEEMSIKLKKLNDDLEFIVKERVYEIAEMVRTEIETLAIPSPDSLERKSVTISVGCAAVIPNNDLVFENLILAADNAMYQAKKSGKNQVKIVEVKAKK